MVSRNRRDRALPDRLPFYRLNDLDPNDLLAERL